MRWGRLDFRSPPPVEYAGFAEQAKRALWFFDIGLIGGVVGGLLAAGAGGRLAMRVVAVTAGDRAQGRITEADEVVGEITVGVTVGFVVFGGLFAGVVCAVIFLLVRMWLPSGLVGGLVLGALVLVMLGSPSNFSDRTTPILILLHRVGLPFRSSQLLRFCMGWWLLG